MNKQTAVNLVLIAVAAIIASGCGTKQTLPSTQLISDFADGTTACKVGTGWTATTDTMRGGKSNGSISIVSPGANDSKYALEVSGTVAPGYIYPWSGVLYFPGTGPMTPANLSRYKGIEFYIKGPGAYNVMLFDQAHGQQPSKIRIVTGEVWTKETIPFSAFSGIDTTNIVGIAFTSGPTIGDYTFSLDDVMLD